jgi:hypothetical protein
MTVDFHGGLSDVTMSTCRVSYRSSAALRTASVFLIILAVAGADVVELSRSSGEDDNGNVITWGLPDAVAPVGKLFEYQLRRGPDSEMGVTGNDNGPGIGDSGELSSFDTVYDYALNVYQVSSCALIISFHQ